MWKIRDVTVFVYNLLSGKFKLQLFLAHFIAVSIIAVRVQRSPRTQKVPESFEWTVL